MYIIYNIRKIHIQIFHIYDAGCVETLYETYERSGWYTQKQRVGVCVYRRTCVVRSLHIRHMRYRNICFNECTAASSPLISNIRPPPLSNGRSTFCMWRAGYVCATLQCVNTLTNTTPMYVTCTYIYLRREASETHKKEDNARMLFIRTELYDASRATYTISTTQRRKLSHIFAYSTHVSRRT